MLLPSNYSALVLLLNAIFTITVTQVNISMASIMLSANLTGVTLKNVRAAAETGVDRISIGSLTKDIKAVDLSMRFEST